MDSKVILLALYFWYEQLTILLNFLGNKSQMNPDMHEIMLLIMIMLIVKLMLKKL